ncbi:POK9 protein, partial [Machaerirhynchus nigripectus]|nr:POK9 protein [Machaerirhynchus nigripectus]
SSSAGLDLPTACTVTILDSSIHLIPTGVNGPLGQGWSALLLGFSSTTLMGLFVLPGVIDADFLGEIKIMVWTPFPPCTVSRGSKIAQLIFFTALMSINTVQKQRGEEGFGSTGAPQIFWTQQLTVQRPTCKGKLSWQGRHVTLTGIIDMGADVTVIS